MFMPSRAVVISTSDECGTVSSFSLNGNTSECSVMSNLAQFESSCFSDEEQSHSKSGICFSGFSELPGGGSISKTMFVSQNSSTLLTNSCNLSEGSMLKVN